MRALLRDRSYRLLLVGQTLSSFGDFAMFLVLAVWVKELTGSNAMAGLAILPFILPSLFGPVLGVYVDRYPRRRVMVATDLAAIGALAPLLWVHTAADVWLIYLSSFLLGTCTVIYQAARSGLIVSMLPSEELGEANGLLQSTNQGVRLLAPLVGAALYTAIGGTAVALVDAATFLVSAVLLMGVHAPPIPREEEPDFWGELREGLRHIVHTADIRRLTIATAFVTLVAGVMEVAIFALIDEGLHRPPAFLGVLSTVQGLGAIIGGITIGAVLRRLTEMRTIAWSLGGVAVGIGLLATANLPIVVVSGIGVGIGVAFFNVALITLVQRRTDVTMQGRVMAALDAAFTLPMAISLALGAGIIALVGFRTVYIVEAISLLAITGYLIAVSREPDPSPEAVALDAIDVDSEPEAAAQTPQAAGSIETS
jgi:MFS family permease